MASGRFNLSNPRITAQVPLTANTVTSIKDLITTFVQTSAVAQALFVYATVANASTRRSTYTPTNSYKGLVVYQTSGDQFYQVEDPTLLNGSDDSGWVVVTTTNMGTIVNFLSDLSGSVDVDSSIGNAGANTTYVMNGFVNGFTPTSTAMTTYGIPLAPGTERTCSGNPKHYYVYALSGTTIRLDLIFKGGNI